MPGNYPTHDKINFYTYANGTFYLILKNGTRKIIWPDDPDDYYKYLRKNGVEEIS